MSSSSGPQHAQAAEGRYQKPAWLQPFLRRTFFDSCTAHPPRRNDKNRYCICCDESACQHCLSSGAHRQHRILKIYRHVYKDVVSLSALERLIDCDDIQPYKCNKRLVIALSPLPHCGPSTGTEGISCDVCKRRLAEPDVYTYCSISCKVKAFDKKSTESDPPFLAVQSPGSREGQNRAGRSEERKNKRKGNNPQRAPFF